MGRTDYDLEQLAYSAALRAQIVSVKARLEAARKYPLNPSMQFEAELLQAQLAALSVEYSRT